MNVCYLRIAIFVLEVYDWKLSAVRDETAPCPHICVGLSIYFLLKAFLEC